MTLRELFLMNPLLTTIGIIVVCFILVKIIRGKPDVKKHAAAAGAAVQEFKTAAVNSAVGGDIIAAITAAVAEHRKKEALKF